MQDAGTCWRRRWIQGGFPAAFGAFEPARPSSPCKRAIKSTEALTPSMLHAGHCRGGQPSLSSVFDDSSSAGAALAPTTRPGRPMSRSELSAPAQGSWRCGGSCLILGEGAALSCFSSCEGPDGIKSSQWGTQARQHRQETPTAGSSADLGGGHGRGGAISARYLTERTRSLKPHGSILSRTRVGGNMD